MLHFQECTVTFKSGAVLSDEDQASIDFITKKSSSPGKTGNASTETAPAPVAESKDPFADDLALTLQTIKDHDARSTTVTKDQVVQQMEESIKAPKIAKKVEINA